MTNFNFLLPFESVSVVQNGRAFPEAIQTPKQGGRASLSPHFWSPSWMSF